jgi:hypothetical protein
MCALSACADDTSGADTVELTNPQALVDCAAPPANMRARMWISGSDEPCELEVDLAGGKTTGTCDAKPGIERTLTIDWFVRVEHNTVDLDLMLAQARGKLDLSKPEEKATFTVKDDDVKSDTCLDMKPDTLNGADVVTIDGVEVPPCDVDDSCAGAAPSAACSNIGEVCASTDPFDTASEPP